MAMMKIIEPNEVLKDFTERLENVSINYMLTGSMAMMFYATPRYTADIDIIIELDLQKTIKFSSVFKLDYYFSENRMRDSISRKSMFNLIHQESSFKVDCIIKKDSEFQKQAFENRKRVDYQGFEVWIIGLEDLIVSKLLWAKDSRSDFQKRDIINLLQKEVNAKYIENWTKKLEVFDLYQECLADKK